MARQKPSDKIDTLRRQQAELAAKLKEAEANARTRKREDEQRSEKIVGRSVLAQLSHEPDSEWSKATLALLARSLTRPADRALFQTLGAATTSAVTPETT